MRAPVPSPCKFSEVDRGLFRPPHVGSLQDTNLGLSKCPILLFLCEVFFLRTCLLDARVLAGLATDVRVAGVTGLRCFVRSSVYADELRMPPFGFAQGRDDKPIECVELLTN